MLAVSQIQETSVFEFSSALKMLCCAFGATSYQHFRNQGFKLNSLTHSTALRQTHIVRSNETMINDYNNRCTL